MSQSSSLPGLLQQGFSHHQAGRLREAEAIYRQLLAENPAHADGWHLLGMAVGQLGQSDSAAQYIARAIELQPQVAFYHYNLGNALKGAGRLEDAQASYARALELKPDYVEASINRGAILLELDRLDEAEACFRVALRWKPDHPNAYYNLATLHLRQRRFTAAAEAANQAIALEPRFAEAHNALGVAQMETDQRHAAFDSFREAIRLDRKNEEFWANWAACLRGQTLSFATVDDDLFQDLLQLLEIPFTAETDAVRPIFSALIQHPTVARILAATRPPARALTNLNYSETAEQLSAIPLLLRILELASISSTDVEEMLVNLRSALLRSASGASRDTRGLAFSAALAVQCFNCEYLFAETAGEISAVEELQTKIASLFEQQAEIPPAWVAALGAYQPLHSFPWARQALERKWPPAIQNLIARQIAEPLEEESGRSSIRRLTPVRDEFSQLMRHQYEQHPYPRWTKPALHFRPEPIGRVMQHIFPHLTWPDYRSPVQPEILIAGCGTGRHALDTASRFLNSQVLAVDLSLISLGYAVRKTRQVGVTNIDYAQADILELGSIGRQFDHVESVGVLHHLRDPLAGWRVLVPLMRAGATMKIGLYSELGRHGVVKAHALIRERGYTSSPEDIRRCRQEILVAAAAGDRDYANLIKGNIFTLSECRDLLFDQREHRYTLVQIEAALAELGLQFLGFELPGQTALRKFQARHPEPQAAMSLPLWHQFELDNPDTFIGMYQFWCRKKT
jgi:tetratricopeptide (TPR) repeat protein/SAM-dependent methyltransferase